MEFPDLASTIERDGYAIISYCIGELMVARLCDSLDARKYGQRNLLAEPVVQELARSKDVRDLVNPLIGNDCFAVKGILFNKTQNSNWKVPWHQDLTITVRNRVEVEGFSPWSVKGGVVNVQAPHEILSRILAIRIHLDANNNDNGPLRVLPGSHNYGRLSSEQIANWDKTNAATCMVPRGGALLMRPLLLHASSACSMPKNRRVIHLEFTADELPGRLQWHTRI